MSAATVAALVLPGGVDPLAFGCLVVAAFLLGVTLLGYGLTKLTALMEWLDVRRLERDAGKRRGP